MGRIRLACTDVDGTLLRNQSPDFDGLRMFGDMLAGLRHRHGTTWAVVTGRHRASIRPILSTFMAIRLIPDYVVLEDAMIYRFDRRLGLRPFWWWNVKLWVKRRRSSRRGRRAVATWQEEMLARFPEAELKSHETIDLWLEFRREEKAEHAEIVLRDLIEDDTEFVVLRWGKELFLAPSAGNKGDAVRKVAGKLDVPLHEVFAVGDGANDVSMLQAGGVGMPACVGNAPREIQRVVQTARGYKAEREAVYGVMEALEHYAGNSEH